MLDNLKDIVQHTHGLGNIEAVKITGNETETLLNSVAEDRKVILEAKFKKVIPEFAGTFGMPNLGKLNTILNIPEYKDGAAITINTQQDADGNTVPSGVHFVNKNGDFKNDYRFMSAEVVNEKLKSVKFRGAQWDVDFVPSLAAIQRLRFQASANSEEEYFVAKTENGALKFYFGDPNSHAGNFVFENAVEGNLTKAWSWPVSAVMSILALSGDKTFKISDAAVAKITVDSGIAEYSYLIPAKT